jgi:hypothetical protein
MQFDGEGVTRRALQEQRIEGVEGSRKWEARKEWVWQPRHGRDSKGLMAT